MKDNGAIGSPVSVQRTAEVSFPSALPLAGRTAPPVDEGSPAVSAFTGERGLTAPPSRELAGALAFAGSSKSTAIRGSVPETGWANGAAPNGRVLATDLSKLDENKLLGPKKSPRLYAVGDSAGAYDPKREPLILVHGIDGDPKDLQSVVDRFKGKSQYQVFILCYDDKTTRTSASGRGMAAEMAKLRSQMGRKTDVTVIAHSMGGLVTREALNQLSTIDTPGGHPIEHFDKVRFLAVDSPWHGWGGPADGPMMDMVRPLMPDAFEDMRAASGMFRGDPEAKNPADRQGLLRGTLPENVSVHLVFADHPNVTAGLDDPALKALPETLVAHYKTDAPVKGDERMENYWQALRETDQFVPFSDAMEKLVDAGNLNAATAKTTLEQFYPRLPGDHNTILQPHKGQADLLDYLEAHVGHSAVANDHGR